MHKGFPEKPACKMAIIQALLFHFHWEPRMIMHTLHVSYPDVYRAMIRAGDDYAGIPWWKRMFQQEAIEAAKAIGAKRGIVNEETGPA